VDGAAIGAVEARVAPPRTATAMIVAATIPIPWFWAPRSRAPRSPISVIRW